ncbi:NAC domain-containing protein 101-like isoform X1 [Asparagus officinalis]|uniref:NAC domain-containing protein 101-like isoform X1 n=2 Tax=Asparagus officinalis TaxID=4686 RepID=UPI00098E78B9|nr:NAC domain-containing protein 101-like isoform X1 [Asparagus officinalis]XP_020254598.1 NAC domain-containing protein 101-like isoform X1 [Asparagus officinalis]XP_020254599.1 NAC domain-containing protein 101-like isoform X1 [Asparagus officinalis]XP_020254600.1 NAC domain-containing protein 101-like isoform X1 [Asparagus officinalis]XP_020254601.1 NAC domain-containing protein 101-like isoform X1 [Asparagus officinalis]XP_020254602.1 NAC domain-containing protein 101-like isoform X1 [Aspa
MGTSKDQCVSWTEGDFQYLNNNKDMHFFSPRHAISSRKGTAKNVKRTAGCGFWNGKGKEQDVFCGSRHVGYRTPLTFVSTEGEKRRNTNWIMHEFHIKPAQNSNKFESMVICRIHKKKTKEDREGGADADSGVAALIEQEEQGTTSAATHVEERPLKRKRVEASSSLPPSSSSLLAFLPCKEAEAFYQLISTMDEKRHTVLEQEVEVDERQVTEMLLKEHEAMTNHFKAAAESGAATSICEQAATYVEDRFRKRKCVEGCSNFCDTEKTSMVNTEAPSQPLSSSPYLSSTWVCAPALDSYEASSSLIDILPPPSQDHWTWEDLEIDVGTVSYLDELMECFSDS